MIPRVRFGRTGLKVTRIALGCFPFGGVNRARGWDPFTPEGRATAISTVHAALDAGINYIDTAPSYGKGNSESIVGEAVEGRREKCYLATKVGYRGLSAEQVMQSVEVSRARLRTDVVDVIQFHGGMYTQDDIDHILDDGLLDVLLISGRAATGRGLRKFWGHLFSWLALRVPPAPPSESEPFPQQTG